MLRRVLLLFFVLLIPCVSAVSVEKVEIQDKEVVITIEGKVSNQIEFFKDSLSEGTYKLCEEDICDFKTRKELRIRLSNTGINEIGDYVLRIQEIDSDGQASVQSHNLRINKENLDICNDGTLNNACSNTKPLFCENGKLVERCGKGTFTYYTNNLELGITTIHTVVSCGDCSAGKTCQKDGNCKEEIKQKVDVRVKLSGAEEKKQLCYTRIKGDLNNDNKVDNVDLKLIERIILGIDKLPEGETCCVDLNDNGNINIFDLLALLKLIGKEERCGEVESIPIGFNNKNMKLYSSKEVFLISDKNWQDVLQLVPVTTWTQDKPCEKGSELNTVEGKHICGFPTLIYHEESSNKVKINPLPPNPISINGVTGDFFSNANGDYIILPPNWSNNFIDKQTNEVTLTLSIYNNKGPETLDISLVDWPNKDILSPKTRNLRLTLQKNQQTYVDFVFNVEHNALKSINYYDYESIIDFIDKYEPEKITMIGNSPDVIKGKLTSKLQNIHQGESQEMIEKNRINSKEISDIYSYWASPIKTVILVANNYEGALKASTFATIKNAPLIIEMNGINNEFLNSIPNVICVGDTQYSNCQKLSLEELENKFIKETKSNKLLLVNPADLNFRLERNNPRFSFVEFYSKSSLSAPILAAARHEVILAVNSEDPSNPDYPRRISNAVREKTNGFDFLTIFASPNSIPMDSNGIVLDSDYAALTDELRFSGTPTWYIAGLILKHGRIFGLSSSDVSTYLARDFYLSNKILLNKEIYTTGFAAWKTPAEDFRKFFRFMGYRETGSDQRASPKDYLNKGFIFYYDHGLSDGLALGPLSSELVYMDNVIFMAHACLTCGFKKAYPNEEELFCANVIRKGAIGYYGGLVADFSPYVFESIHRLLSADYLADINQNFATFVLIGDPAYKYNIDNKLNRKELTKLSSSDEGEVYVLNSEVVKLDGDTIADVGSLLIGPINSNILSDNRINVLTECSNNNILNIDVEGNSFSDTLFRTDKGNYFNVDSWIYPTSEGKSNIECKIKLLKDLPELEFENLQISDITIVNTLFGDAYKFTVNVNIKNSGLGECQQLNLRAFVGSSQYNVNSDAYFHSITPGNKINFRYEFSPLKQSGKELKVEAKCKSVYNGKTYELIIPLE